MVARSNRNLNVLGNSSMRTLTAEDVSTIRAELAKDNVKRAEENIRDRDHLVHLSDRTEILSIVFAGITSILSFAAASVIDENRSRWVSWVAGICGVVGVSLSTFSSYTAREANERVARLNVILKDAGLPPQPLTGSSKAEEVGENYKETPSHESRIVPRPDDEAHDPLGTAEEEKEEVKDIEVL
jgi:hypothetical protein